MTSRISGISVSSELSGESTDDHSLVLHVADEGEAESDSRDPLSQRAGLGLSIVRVLAEAHRGSVEVNGDQGGGITGSVRLPRFHR